MVTRLATLHACPVNSLSTYEFLLGALPFLKVRSSRGSTCRLTFLQLVTMTTEKKTRDRIKGEIQCKSNLSVRPAGRKMTRRKKEKKRKVSECHAESPNGNTLRITGLSQGGALSPVPFFFIPRYIHAHKEIQKRTFILTTCLAMQEIFLENLISCSSTKD
jgi:hypothetical protein